MTTASLAAELHGLLVVDKSLGPTSHDVVAVARRALGTRAVGHTGTLDPTASGVLVLLIGEATKLVNLLGAGAKEYEGELALGSETTTLDAAGEPLFTAPVPPLTRAEVERAALRFQGEIEQRAPAVSAIKVDGKSLHKRVRAGEQVEAPVRTVRVDALAIEACEGERIRFRVRCGKGFYVRSLARDLALALGTRGHLAALRRTYNAGFGLEHAVTFEALRAAARGGEAERAPLRALCLPLASVVKRLPHALLDEVACLDLRHGRAVPVSALGEQALPEGAQLIALSERGEPIAIVERSLDRLRVVRGFQGVGGG